eukprot:TRINITY_DN34436_c0_g1_i1.p1 TRINITY_DN34436_c0_g1~~TRINITY_DN34436_c0_g1_i1.p1  ORF type:complete len:114 (-),score=14.97 TRINITY_DN34436_c0_g1_i1:112-453(-)
MHQWFKICNLFWTLSVFSKNKIKSIFIIAPPIHKRVCWNIIISDSIKVLLDPLQRQLGLKEEMESLVREVFPLMENRGEKCCKYFYFSVLRVEAEERLGSSRRGGEERGVGPS